MNYYNEYDRHAAAWLRELISDKLIPDGVVDERSITDIQPADLAGYTQCHFFAGIGGWAYALQLAGWPADRPVWTGSCPCQPFSVAGKGKGAGDVRHLWPEFARLIRECRPPVIYGEQVAAAIGHGWLDGVFADLEGEGYACGSAVLGAHSVGAPHIRQRLYWMADATDHGHPAAYGLREEAEPSLKTGEKHLGKSEGSCDTLRLADGEQQGLERRVRGRQDSGRQDLDGHPGCCGSTHWDNSYWHHCRDGKSRRVPAESEIFPLAHGIPGRVGLLRGSGNAIVPQCAASFIVASSL